MTIPEAKPKPSVKPDWNDCFYYCGLAMVFIGLAVSVSVGMALIVVGSVLAGVALINSYALVFGGRK